MTRRTNIDNERNVVVVEYDEIDRALRAMPARVRNLVLYECGSNVNPVQLVEVANTFGGPSWYEIEQIVREFSRNEHMEAYNGVYPGVQRTLTAKDGPSPPNAVNKQSASDAIRMLRRSGNMRSRRDLRRITVFFPDLTAG